MRRNRDRLGLRTSLAMLALIVGMLLAGCAGPAKLAKESDEALAKGDLRLAYQRALKAIEKDPLNQPAREAYEASSARLVQDHRQRVLAAATADTLRAADLALAFHALRAEVAAHDSAVPTDAAYDASETRILRTAARRWYGRGRLAMAAKHPKEAYRDFVSARHYVDDFLDAGKQQDAAFAAALTRIAVLPFADGVRVPGLAQDLCERITQRVRSGVNKLIFTELLPIDSVEVRVSIAQAREMTRDEALALGRRLGVQRIVYGHLAGLRSSSNQSELVTPVYRRLASKDSQGNAVVRWEEQSLRVVLRDREVSVQYDFDILDVRSGVSLAHRELPGRTSARIAWTDFRPEGGIDDYALLPNDVRKADPDRGKQADAQWNERMGSWTLPAFMQKAREDRQRSHYDPRYRSEFFTDTHRRPVWLGELPGEEDLAYVAVDDAWRSVLAAMQELDPKD